MDKALVSIIMPVHNGATSIARAIESVLQQVHQEWELIVIDNASNDDSARIARSFDDPRIIVSQEMRKGVAFARNKGLDLAQGKFICFLDADDRLPESSLSSRLKLFAQQEALGAVDGQVIRDSGAHQWTPKIKGDVLQSLLDLNDRAFTGVTWMLRSENIKDLRFNTGLSHCEDLYFFITCAKKGLQYDFVELPVYEVVGSKGSAMDNLRGLETGYMQVLELLEKDFPDLNIKELKQKVRYIMWRSYLKQGKVLPALRVFFSSLPS